jgi:hypothetical protein
MPPPDEFHSGGVENTRRRAYNTRSERKLLYACFEKAFRAFYLSELISKVTLRETWLKP